AGGQRHWLLLSRWPGAGKTGLIGHFLRRLDSLAPNGRPVALVGNCFERFGAGEPYLPVWEAIHRIAGQRPDSPLAALVARSDSAPPRDHAAAAPEAPTAQMMASDRLLRDLVDALESLAATTPVVFV